MGIPGERQSSSTRQTRQSKGILKMSGLAENGLGLQWYSYDNMDVDTP